MRVESAEAHSHVRSLVIVSIGLTLLSLTGCTNPHIFERFNIDNGDSLSIDAKQRVILVGTRTIDHQHVVCAEPSPDALSASAAAFSASGGDPEVKAAASAAYQEAAANIGIRTPTIQLLRDGLYRACEAYMNGVLDQGGYSTILRNYDRVMVSLMAIDAAAGTPRAPNVTIVSGAAQAPSVATAPAPTASKSGAQGATPATEPSNGAATDKPQTGDVKKGGTSTETPDKSATPAKSDSTTGNVTVATPTSMDHGDQVIKSVLDYMLDDNKWMLAVCLSQLEVDQNKNTNPNNINAICEMIIREFQLNNTPEARSFRPARTFVNDTTAAGKGGTDVPPKGHVAKSTGHTAKAEAPSLLDQEFVKAVQAKLNGAGFSVGAPDGKPGKKTTAAIKAFQKKNGLRETGTLDTATLRKLDL